jgi:hypothetical protein
MTPSNEVVVLAGKPKVKSEDKEETEEEGEEATDEKAAK